MLESGSLRKARKFARGLELKSSTEMMSLSKRFNAWEGKTTWRHSDSSEAEHCRQRLEKLGDWLGTGTIWVGIKKYRTFTEARAFARNLKLRNQKTWRLFCKGKLPAKGYLPEDIPASPHKTYANKGWKGMGDWLGNGYNRFLFFGHTEYSNRQGLCTQSGLKSQAEWITFSKGKMPAKGRLPGRHPASPGRVYARKGWKGFGDWLGNGLLLITSKCIVLSVKRGHLQEVLG